MSNIFVSYRRDDSSGHTGRICDRLAAYFGEERVFIDIDTIEPGKSFTEVIDQRMASCEVMLVVIGKRWLTTADEQGKQRLLNQNDFVRREVLAGIERGITLIPVLVGGASMPGSADLPQELAGLALRQAWELPDKGFHRHVDEMISVIERKLREAEEQRQREAAEQLRLKRSDISRRKARIEFMLLLIPSFGFASTYYVTGQNLRLIGYAAPWFILLVLLFSCALRTLHLESHALLGRDDIYKAVRTAFGPSIAAFASAALLFDYLLIGLICGVTAGIYLAEIINKFLEVLHLSSSSVSPALFGQVLCILMVIGHWRGQTKGVAAKQRSLPKLLTAVFAVVLIGWSVRSWGLLTDFQYLPPFEVHPTNVPFFWSFDWRQVVVSHPVCAVLIGLSLSILALTPNRNTAETRELVELTGINKLRWITLATWTTELIFPLTMPFAVVILIPDEVRTIYLDWTLGELPFYEVGPLVLRFAFAAIVTIVGMLSLWKALGRAFSASSRLLVEMTDDRDLPRWLHSRRDRYQSRHTFVHIVAIALLLLLVLTGGNIEELTDMYAFGVVCGYCMQATALIVLRRRSGSSVGWKVPLNIRIAGFEVPIGLLLLTVCLITLASVGVIVRPKAAIAGSAFALAAFLLLQFGATPKGNSLERA